MTWLIERMFEECLEVFLLTVEFRQKKNMLFEVCQAALIDVTANHSFLLPPQSDWFRRSQL